MDDREFIRKCTSGEPQAWDEFIKKYSRLVYNYIFSTLKTRGARVSQETIEDIFQDIFICLFKDDFRKLKTFRGINGCTFASWLRLVVINHTLDHLDKIKPLVALDEEQGEGLSIKDLLMDPRQTAQEEAVSKERLKGLEDCIRLLKSEEKYFLELHVHRGLALEDLKEHFHLNRPALDMRKTRILEKLRDCFRNKGFFG
jgi:RNA polymerase sigma-70 factor (ECF subfamily)